MVSASRSRARQGEGTTDNAAVAIASTPSVSPAQCGAACVLTPRTDANNSGACPKRRSQPPPKSSVVAGRFTAAGRITGGGSESSPRRGGSRGRLRADGVPVPVLARTSSAPWNARIRAAVLASRVSHGLVRASRPRTGVAASFPVSASASASACATATATDAAKAPPPPPPQPSLPLRPPPPPPVAAPPPSYLTGGEQTDVLVYGL